MKALFIGGTSTISAAIVKRLVNERDWEVWLINIADALGVELNAYHIASEYLSAVGDKYGFNFKGGFVGDKAVSSG